MPATDEVWLVSAKVQHTKKGEFWSRSCQLRPEFPHTPYFSVGYVNFAGSHPHWDVRIKMLILWFL